MGSRVSAKSHPHRSDPHGSSKTPLLQVLYAGGKQRHLLHCGSISSSLRRCSLVLVLSLFWSSAMESLHYSCPNSAVVLNWCYFQYISTLNCLKLEFSDNDRFNHPCSLMAY